MLPDERQRHRRSGVSRPIVLAGATEAEGWWPAACQAHGSAPLRVSNARQTEHKGPTLPLMGSQDPISRVLLMNDLRQGDPI